jgi:GT2 family glycosyltransferase
LRDKTRLDSAGQQLLPNGQAGNLGWMLSVEENFNKPDEVFSASAAGAVYKRSVLASIGGFDEAIVAYYDDIDVGFRQQLIGYKCLYNPKAVMYHWGSSSPKNYGRALRLVERNMVINLLKNMPLELLSKYRAKILKTIASPLQIEDYQKKSINYQQWLLGKLDFSSLLSQTMKERKRIQASRRVSISYIDAILNKHPKVVTHL